MAFVIDKKGQVKAGLKILLGNEFIDTLEMALKRMDRKKNHIFDPRKSFLQALYTVISLVLHSQTSYPQSPHLFQIFLT